MADLAAPPLSCLSIIGNILALIRPCQCNPAHCGSTDGYAADEELVRRELAEAACATAGAEYELTFVEYGAPKFGAP